jgi:hypothetical protein
MSRRRRVRRSRPCSCQARSRFVESASNLASGLAGLGTLATILGGLRATLERSRIGGGIFAGVQSRFTVPSAATVANSLVRFLFAEHTDVLIVKIDLTRIGPAFPKPSSNVAPDDSEFRACLLATWHLDAGELEETSVGNYSGHAPTTPCQLRTSAANAIEAPSAD